MGQSGNGGGDGSCRQAWGNARESTRGEAGQRSNFTAPPPLSGIPQPRARRPRRSFRTGHPGCVVLRNRSDHGKRIGSSIVALGHLARQLYTPALASNPLVSSLSLLLGGAFRPPIFLWMRHFYGWDLWVGNSRVQYIAHFLRQAPGRERLGDEVHRAFFHALRHQDLVRVAGHEQHGHLRIFRRQPVR